MAGNLFTFVILCNGWREIRLWWFSNILICLKPKLYLRCSDGCDQNKISYALFLIYVFISCKRDDAYIRCIR